MVVIVYRWIILFLFVFIAAEGEAGGRQQDEERTDGQRPHHSSQTSRHNHCTSGPVYSKFRYAKRISSLHKILTGWISIKNLKTKQESILVGCVPSTFLARGGGFAQPPIGSFHPPPPRRQNPHSQTPPKGTWDTARQEVTSYRDLP